MLRFNLEEEIYQSEEEVEEEDEDAEGAAADAEVESDGEAQVQEEMDEEKKLRKLQLLTKKGMRGKMSTNCLVHACQALVVGLVLFSIGAVMSTLGFHADGLLDPNNNSTEEDASYYYTAEGRSTVRFSKLSYAGPIVMGIGGFIIVATCVMTFEARDSAAKVGPASYSGVRNSAAVYSNTYRARTRSLDVRSVASQTMPNDTTSVTALHIFDKKALLETFKKFSRTIRTGSTAKDEEDQFHRSPSAPSLLETDLPSDMITNSTSKSRSRRNRETPNPNQGGDQVTGSSSGSTSNVTNLSGGGSAIRGLRRSSILTRHRPKIPPALKHLRQAMSVDCPTTSPFILHAGTGTGISETGTCSTSTGTGSGAGSGTGSSNSGGSSNPNPNPNPNPNSCLESKNITTSCKTTSKKTGREASKLLKSQSQSQGSYICTTNPNTNPKGGKLKGRASISSISMTNSMDNTSPFFSISDGGDSGISISVDAPNNTEGESENHHHHHRPLPSLHHQTPNQQQHQHRHTHSRNSSTPNVHFEPATVEIHSTSRHVNGVKSALIHKRSNTCTTAPSSTSPVSSSIEILSGSSSNSSNSIRIIPSVLPSTSTSGSGFGFGFGSASTSRTCGENVTLFYTGRATSIAGCGGGTSGQSTSSSSGSGSSCTTGGGRIPPLTARFRSEISTCRPTLMRQSRVIDQEITRVVSPDSDEEEKQESKSKSKNPSDIKGDKGKEKIEEIKLVIPEEDSELDDNELEV